MILIFGSMTLQTSHSAGLLVLRDGAISHNRPQITSDRTYQA